MVDISRERCGLFVLPGLQELVFDLGHSISKDHSIWGLTEHSNVAFILQIQHEIQGHLQQQSWESYLLVTSNNENLEKNKRPIPHLFQGSFVHGGALDYQSLTLQGWHPIDQSLQDDRQCRRAGEPLCWLLPVLKFNQHNKTKAWRVCDHDVITLEEDSKAKIRWGNGPAHAWRRFHSQVWHIHLEAFQETTTLKRILTQTNKRPIHAIISKTLLIIISMHE